MTLDVTKISGRAKLLTIFSFLIQSICFGQSPFNYGQHKKVYFISSALRNRLDIKTIYTIDQRHDHDTLGLSENWNVTVISFDTSYISDMWAPVLLSNTYKYNFNSLTKELEYINGTSYEFSKGRLTSYGGTGHGVFERYDITRFSDTVSIVASSYIGGGNNHPVNYSKEVFSRHRRLLYVVSYPTPVEGEALDPEAVTFEEMDRLLHSNVSPEKRPDTTYFKYDSKGLLLGIGEGLYINSPAEVKKLFATEGDMAAYKFHQCYVGKVTMEKYFTKLLGYTPDLVLLEIYEQGVFSFSMNASDKKYYRTKDIILE